MKSSIVAILLASLWFGNAATAEDAQALLDKTGIKSGLCLVIGAKDTQLASDLAGKSSLYVQLLQPDAMLAAQWGLAVAASASREKLGVRDAAFDPEHYGSDLFNLIIVENTASSDKATLTDFNRMLTPDGVVAFRDVPAFASSAKELNMTAVAAPPFGAAFKKAVTERTFKPCDSVKWRAGTRAQISSGWRNHGSSGSVFFYTERLEIQGDAKASRWLLQVRDAYNGRTLWTMEGARVIGGSRDGRLFVLNGDGKLLSCDARTGSVQYEFPADEFVKHVGSARPATDDIVVMMGYATRACTNDGKKLWETGENGPSLVTANAVYILCNDSLIARNTKDGKLLWKSPSFAAHGGAVSLSDKCVHATSWGGAMATYDKETGKELWRYKNPVPKDWSGYFVTMPDKIFAMHYCPYPKTEDSDLFVSTLNYATGTVDTEAGTKQIHKMNMCAPVVQRAGDYIFYYFGIWVDPKTMKSEFPWFAHPSCGFGAHLANGMVYNFPSRKAGPLQGVSDLAPADMTFDHEAGGKVFQKYADAPANGDVAKDSDWVMFRANPQRSNSTKTSPGDKLAKLWELSLGAGTSTFGQLCSIRSGLTQAVCANGLAIVADMDAQRIVAVDAQSGKEKWIFPVGARVEFSPTLYKGLCLFAAKDGFVYCLNATTGTLCWKRLIPAGVRFIGGQEKLESLWPVTSDVLIENGVGYACAGLHGGVLGGLRAIAFRPENGDLVWGQCYTEGGAGGLFVGTGNAKQVLMNDCTVDVSTGKRGGNRSGPGFLSCNNPIDDYLAGGVSLPRNGEDRMGIQLSNGIIQGKTIAFDETLSVAFMGGVGGEQWENGFMSFYARSKPGKNLWEIKDDLITDDIVVTPSFVYVVGHHYREAKAPELRVVSREDGKTLASHELNTLFPAWNGMSVAGDKIFIATGDGKLLCYAKQ